MAPEVLTEMGLEMEQFTGAQRPFGRMVLGGRMNALLLALRVYAIVAIPLVTYAFIRALHS
jgi:hypothetical protein